MPVRPEAVGMVHTQAAVSGVHRAKMKSKEVVQHLVPSRRAGRGPLQELTSDFLLLRVSLLISHHVKVSTSGIL